MIRPIDIRLNAAHPNLPLPEAVTFTGSPSTVLIRGVPPNCGRWAITAVFVAASFPDGSTTTRAAVQSANGVWVATLPATATSGRTANGIRVIADGVDENGDVVTGYILGVADFAVASLDVTPAPEPGETSYQMLYFDEAPSVLHKGDVTKIDGVLKFYNGSAWEPFADLSDYYTAEQVDEAIDKLAAYYITADAQGNPFATHAALVNAQTYYSGGAARTPTRNDYAVVSADETHGGAEWRYIYAVDAQGVGQWEPQYAVEGVIAYDNTVTPASANGVKSSGIWSAIWGALAAFPTGFSSLYDWVVDQLGRKADDSAVVTLTGDQTVAGAKTFTGAGTFNNGMTVYGGALVEGSLSVSFGPNYGDGGWNITKDIDGNLVLGIFAGDNSGSLTLPFSTGTLALVSQIPDVAARLQQIAAFPAFDAAASYAVGDTVTYQGQIYECTTAHSGAWASGDFAVRTLGYLLASKQAKITASGLLKGDGAGGVTAAVAGEDYTDPGDLRYALGEPMTPAPMGGGYILPLEDRTVNLFEPDTAYTSLSIVVPPKPADGGARDFFLRVDMTDQGASLSNVTIATSGDPAAYATVETADGSLPSFPQGSVTMLYFSEVKEDVFLLTARRVVTAQGGSV